MSMNRLVLALAPLLLGACSDDSSATGNASSGGTGAGTTGTATTGTDGSTVTSGSDGSTVTSGSDGSTVTSGSDGSTVTSGSDGTVTSSTTATSSTTGGGTTDGAGGSTGTTGTTGMGGSGGSGGVTVGPMTCPYTAPADPDTFPQNWTSSEVTVFNDNGGWTWYNDERVVVDAEAGKIVVSSAASSASSQNSSPNVDAVIHDLATGTNDKMTLGSLSYSDDHNNGGILVKAPGQYFVAWTHHNQDCTTHWRNYDNGAWGAADTFEWGGQGCPWGSSQSHVTYNNLWNMSSEGRYYNFIRSVDTSPNFLVSEDEGQNWTFGGRLTASPQQGYNAGYYKYWGNGVDRVDFFATEAHPRDADTSLFHGYIKGEKTYDSLNVEQDDTLLDTNAPEIKDFTTVFPSGGMLDGVALHCLWNFDIARYADGTIGVLWQGREGGCGKDNTNPNHRIAYSRFDGSTWTATYLVRGGETLYADRSDWWEEDYLGGAALDPDDPHVIYVSTTIDPRDDSTTYPHHEIWKGVTCDDGASFEWTPMTMNSQVENVRPVVPQWDANNTAVLWFRGNYQTAQMYSAEVVGIITQQ